MSVVDDGGVSIHTVNGVLHCRWRCKKASIAIWCNSCECRVQRDSATKWNTEYDTKAKQHSKKKTCSDIDKLNKDNVRVITDDVVCVVRGYIRRPKM